MLVFGKEKAAFVVETGRDYSGLTDQSLQNFRGRFPVIEIKRSRRVLPNHVGEGCEPLVEQEN
jgi:hypothetical protein